MFNRHVLSLFLYSGIFIAVVVSSVLYYYAWNMLG
jgi:hypothetical protein